MALLSPSSPFLHRVSNVNFLIMVNKCSAYGCTNGYNGTEPGTTMHRFPFSNPELLKAWSAKLGRKDFTPSNHSRICSKHFHSSCFVVNSTDRNSSRKKKSNGRLLKRRLKPEAVPTIFPVPSISHAQAKRLRSRANLLKEGMLLMREKMKIHLKTLIHGEMQHEHGRQLACVCNEEYNKERFTLQCNSCDKWLHPECLNSKCQTYSELVNNVLCAQCNPQLYCLCQQPYEESMFYICCDRCLEWFHGHCVGILQSEAGSLDEYICPNCKQNSCKVDVVNMKALTGEDYEKLNELISCLKSHQSSWPFCEPADKKYTLYYYDVVEQPMDLLTMEKKLNERQYFILKEFIGDLTKMFDNCRYYHPEDSVTYQCAEDLESFFVKKINALKYCLDFK